MFQTKFIIDLKGVKYPEVNPYDFLGIKELEQIRREKNRLKIMEGIVGVGLTSFPTIPTSNVKDYSSLERVLQKRNQLDQTIQHISELSVELPNVDTTIEKDLKIASERFDLSNRIMRTEEEVKRLTGELEAIKCDIGDTCPLCEQGIDH